VSRYNLSRSHKSVTVQDLNCVYMRVSECMNHYNLSLVQEHLPAGRQESKNHDELTNYTVRVNVSLFIFYASD
jgi:hypothetical protein